MMLSFENVSKTKNIPNQREKHQILLNTTFELEHGDRLCILGDKNSGAAVLLRLITGAALPSSGRVIRNARFSPPIGYVGSFHRELTGEENIKFTCKLYGQKPKPVIQFVGDFLENHKALKQPMKTYKDGFGKGVAFALSIAMDFDVYVAKAPIATGSKDFQHKCMQAFTEKTKNSSLIIATNSIALARKHTNKALVINEGSARLFNELEDGFSYFNTLTNDNSNTEA